MLIGYWCESQKKRDRYEDPYVGGWEMLLHRLWWYGLDRSGSGQGPVEGSCENSDVPSGS
jgi:hypothetical protein